MRIGLVAGAAGVVGVALGAGSVLRDCSLTCNVGYRLSPFAFIAIALAILPFTALQVRLASNTPFLRWQIGSVLFCAAWLIAFRAAAWAGFAPRIVYLSFYVVFALLVALLSSNLFSLARRLARSGEELERGLGLLAAGLLGGNLFGSFAIERVTAYLRSAHGIHRNDVFRDHLMLVMAGVFLLLIPILLLAQRAEDATPPIGGSRGDKGDSLGTILGWIRGDAFLARFSAFIALGTAGHVLLNYVFYWIVNDQTDAAMGRTDVYARFYVFLNLASLALLFVGFRKVMDRLGIFVCALVLPVLLFSGSGVLALASLLSVVFGLRISEGALFSTLHRAAQDRLWAGIDPARAAALRPVLNGVVSRAGEAAAAVAILLFTFVVPVTLRGVILIMGLVFGLWAAAGLYLRKVAR